MFKIYSTFALILVLVASVPEEELKLAAEAYVPKDSREYAIFSGLAYCPKKCLQAWNCGGGKEITDFGEVTHINNDLTLAAGFIGYHKGKNLIVVAWRGSANAQNWIEDFEFDKVEYNCKGCEIHQGFFYDYLLVEEKTNEKVQALLAKYPTANILCTGHSMGAALSEISGIRLKAKFGRNVHVHNFGCPRIGNNNMAQYVANQVDTLYRVVHNRDLIPHLPPEPLEYHHSAFEVFFDQGMTNYKICNISGEDSTCSNKFAPDYSIIDHGFYFLDLGTLKC